MTFHRHYYYHHVRWNFHAHTSVEMLEYLSYPKVRLGEHILPRLPLKRILPKHFVLCFLLILYVLSMLDTNFSAK